MSGEDRYDFNHSLGFGMDVKDVIQVGLFVINLLVLGLACVLWNMLQDAKKDARDAATAAKASDDKVSAHELYCARTYVTQEGLTSAIQNLEKTVAGLVDAVKTNMEQNRQDVRDLYEKINQKQDKEK